jgi:hypothetical protein
MKHPYYSLVYTLCKWTRPVDISILSTTVFENIESSRVDSHNDLFLRYLKYSGLCLTPKHGVYPAYNLTPTIGINMGET